MQQHRKQHKRVAKRIKKQMPLNLKPQNIEHSCSFLYHVTGVWEGQNMEQCDVTLILVLNNKPLFYRGGK